MVPFPTYLDRFNRPDWLKSADPPSWMTGVFLMLGIVALGAWIPWTSPHVQLAPAWPLLATAVWIFICILCYLVLRNEGNSRRFRALVLLGSGWMEFFVMTLIATSGTWAARSAFGALLVFAMTAHGMGMRVTANAPYLPVVSSVLCVLAAAISHSSAVAVYISGFAAAGLVGMFVFGRMQLEKDRQDFRRQQEQEALSASLLSQSYSAAARLEHRLTELMGAHHDARNLLTNAVLASRGLQRKLALGDGPPDVATLQATLGRIDSALSLVSSVFTDSLRPGSADASVDAGAALRKQLEDFRLKRAGLLLHLGPLPDVTLSLPGGETTFRRILDNLLLNAAEGDGTQAARNLWLEANLEDGKLHLRLSDDVPGFPPDVLSSGRRRFSSKPDGSGLGLLTVDSLERACTGVLLLFNRPHGGAQVDVFLPVPDALAGESSAHREAQVSGA